MGDLFHKTKSYFTTKENAVPTEAHTNPVYVYLNRELPFHTESARHIITRLEGSMETIPNSKIVERLRGLKAELEKLMRGRPASLPRPKIP